MGVDTAFPEHGFRLCTICSWRPAEDELASVLNVFFEEALGQAASDWSPPRLPSIRRRGIAHAAAPQERRVRIHAPVSP